MPSRGSLGPSWGPLGQSWGQLGQLGALLGRVRAALGAVLDNSCAVFGCQKLKEGRKFDSYTNQWEVVDSLQFDALLGVILQPSLALSRASLAAWRPSRAVLGSARAS